MIQGWGRSPGEGDGYPLQYKTVKSPPAIQETRVQSLGQEDPLDKDMATHPCVLAYRSPQTEELSGLQSLTNTFTHYLNY